VTARGKCRDGERGNPGNKRGGSEVSVVLATGRSNGANALREAATAYKVDTDAIALKVKQEFAAKAKAKREGNPEFSGTGKSRKAA
jgi:ParB family chromosome partitioning protein